MAALVAFDPHVAGTLPLGIDVPGSDVDILCHAPDPDAFKAAVTRAFGACAGFAVREWSDDRTVIAGFHAHGWAFELFGSPLPAAEQAGWRHFVVERRLLDLGGADFREAVMALRRAGAKTEPAFVQVLGLTGDPYLRLYELYDAEDAVLSALLVRQ